MKICMLTTSFPRFEGDFAGKSVYNLASGLVKKNVQVLVITPHEKGLKSSEVMNGIKIVRFKYMFLSALEKVAYGDGMPTNLSKSILAKIGLPFFVFSLLLKSLKYSKNYDIIHAQWVFSGIIACIIKKLFRKPFILTIRHHQHQIYPQKIYKYVLKSADKVISPHINLSETLLNFNILNYAELPNIVDVKNISLSTQKKFKNEFQLNGEKLVTFVARLEQFRDPLTFIDSIPFVLKNYKNVKFLVIGNGSLFPLIKEKIIKLNLQNSVIMTGTRSDVNTILSLSTMFVAISPIENIWCNCLVEAMSLGIPSIVSKSGFSKKILNHLQNSYLIHPRNKNELAEAIVTLLKNEKLRTKLSQNAKLAVQKAGFDNENNIKKIINIYKQNYS